MSRAPIVLLALLAGVVFMRVAPAHAETAAQQSIEGNTDRPGSDYRTLDLPAQPPGSLIQLTFICSNDCFGDTQCKSWTLVRAGVQGPNAKCWLKTAIPAARASSACTSGVVARVYEPGLDRPGYDYKNFALASPSPASCSSSCNGDKSCEAWTYVNPGLQGPQARCWMKSVAPAADVNSCCTSGVVSRPPIVR